jgi:hypothetical protein
MTKFSSPDDPGFVAVSGELRRWVKKIGAVGKHASNANNSNITAPIAGTSETGAAGLSAAEYRAAEAGATTTDGRTGSSSSQ